MKRRSSSPSLGLLPARIHPFLLSLTIFLFCAAVFGLGNSAFSKLVSWKTSVFADGRAGQDDGIWRDAGETRDSHAALNSKGRRLYLSGEGLARVLERAPMESAAPLSESDAMLSLPMPDGSFARFQIQASPILEPGLAAQFPEITSYRGQGLDDPLASMRCDWSPRGFHALMLLRDETVSIHAVDPGDAVGGSAGYVSYYGRDVQGTMDETGCLTGEIHRAEAQAGAGEADAASRPMAAVGATLRSYRIAVAATQEYTNHASLGGGSVAGAIASIAAWLNGVNAIYERELSVRLMLIANNNLIVHTAEPDPFTNGAALTMLDQVRPALRDAIGQANYDIGHVLGTGGSGVAYVGVACNNSNNGGDGLGPLKGGGVSLVNGPAGNNAYTGLLAHEIGHQFGANHSFNATTAGSCGPNRSASSAVESGGGLTIMAYSGVCSPDNISSTRDLRFHSLSQSQIAGYISASAGCATQTATGNSVPAIAAGGDYTIPRNTPFTLTAAGSDADAADLPNLSFVWEQFDVGGASYGNPSYSDLGDPSTTTRPIFRPFSPAASPSRTFPSLGFILNNANVPPATIGGLQTAESLPNVPRSINFRATVRDNRGGVSDDSVVLMVDGASGPFLVTQPNTALSWASGSNQTVAWSVNNTNNAPVNCAGVRITMSTDGGNTFPYVLAAAAANDGSETIAIPGGLGGATARVKVEALDNIFFDISDVNFTIAPEQVTPPTVGGISPSAGPVGGNITISGSGFTGVSAVKFTSNVAAAFVVNNDAQLTTTVPAGAATGPITISKPGAPDVQTGVFSVVPCDYSISPASRNHTQGGGDGTVAVTVAAGCTWTAASNAAWVTIASGGGVGGGIVGYSVAANAGAARDGTLTIAGQTFTVTQDGAPAPAGLQYYPLPFPLRLLDTRPGQPACDSPGAALPGNGIRTQPARITCNGVSIPSNARAITGNITTVQSGGGYLTLFPSDAAQPTVASTNYGPNEVVNNVFTVGLGAADGAFKLFATSNTDVVADVTGYYAPPGGSGLYFHPLSSPIRLLETRTGQPGCFTPGAKLTGNADTPLQARITCNGITIPASAQAIVGNATTVDPGGGWLTLYPSGTARPLAASSNFSAGQIANAPFNVALGADGRFMIYVTSATHLVVDVLGYFSPDAVDANGSGFLFYPLPRPVRLLETRPGFGGCYTPGAPLAATSTRTQPARGVCDGLTIPANAAGIIGNATVVGPAAGGYLTFWPSGAAQPTVAASNFTTGQVFNRHFTVGLGNADGAFKIFTSAGTHQVIDLSGYFAP